MTIFFVLSLITMGMGLGLSFAGTLDFEIIDSYKTEIYDTKEIEIDMSKNLVIPNYRVEYIIDDINNVKLEYKVNKYYDVSYETVENNGFNIFNVYSHNTQEFKMIKEYLKYINDKKILNFDRQNINIIKIYASSENIEILKNNLKDYNI